MHTRKSLKSQRFLRKRGMKRVRRFDETEGAGAGAECDMDAWMCAAPEDVTSEA